MTNRTHHHPARQVATLGLFLEQISDLMLADPATRAPSEQALLQAIDPALPGIIKAKALATEEMNQLAPAVLAT